MNILKLLWITAVYAPIYRLFHPNSFVMILDENDDEEMYSEVVYGKMWNPTTQKYE
jgi:hypothetical protein